MMKFPNNSILVYIALGDAYCVASEYIKLPEEIDRALRSLEFKEYVDHPRYEIPKGFYTDDTEMSVANANVLLYNDQPFTVEMFAHEYVSEFNRGGRRKGYARKFQEFLEKVKNAQEFLENINPKSDRNGAAMRAVPIGALQSIDDVLGVAELQARITHNTSEGILSAQVVALAAHFALYEDEPFRRLDQYCLDNLPARSHKKYPDIFKYRWSGGAVTAKSWAPVSITTIHAVIDLLKYQTSFSLPRKKDSH